MDFKTHWDKVYSDAEINNLGWYEETPAPSIKLIEKCNLKKDSEILDVGTGASTLLKYFLDEGYKNITALDISEEALSRAKEKLDTGKSKRIKWIIDDITRPKNLNDKFDLWHDRTVLHFLTEEEQQKGYLATLNKTIKADGYVIIAVFSPDGAKKCSGLDVKNYDEKMLSNFLGNEYRLIEHFNYLYIQPSGGERPYVYTLFKREFTS